MRQAHHPSLKFHTIYSVVLASVFIVLMISLKNIAFGLALLFLGLYVVGNGIIHSQKNQLTRDTLIEYIIVSLVVLLIVIDIFR